MMGSHGIVVRTPDSQSENPGFESRTFLCPRSTQPCIPHDALAPHLWSCGVTQCRAEGDRKLRSVQCQKGPWIFIIIIIIIFKQLHYNSNWLHLLSVSILNNNNELKICKILNNIKSWSILYLQSGTSFPIFCSAQNPAKTVENTAHPDSADNGKWNRQSFFSHRQCLHT